MSNLQNLSNELALILQDAGKQTSAANYRFFNDLECYLQQSAENAEEGGYEDLEPAENIKIYLADQLEWTEEDAADFLKELYN